jgi:hypothetical protein
MDYFFLLFQLFHILNEIKMSWFIYFTFLLKTFHLIPEFIAKNIQPKVERL